MLTRADASALVLAAKQARGMSFEGLASQIGRHEVWVASAMTGFS